jgi:histidinol-phosphatase
VREDLALALELATVADAITLPRFRALDLAVETKPDLTPVTEADRAAEQELRQVLAERHPNDAVLGEEEGETPGSSGRRWILDPIDGTKNYSRGIPVWGTLVALEEAGEIVVGVVSAPALGRRWWAAQGQGAFADGTPIHVSRISRIEEAVVSYRDARSHLGHDGVSELVARAWHAATYSDFWAHVLVAEGSVDAALEPVMNPWDIAAVKVIVDEAGGRMTDFTGAPRIDSGTGISTNGLLHDELLAAVAPGQS